MDREQEEIQFLGFFGVFKESFNIIFSWRKIFTQITLALILPLSFIFLADIEISKLLFDKILHDEHMLHHTREGTPRYSKLSDILSSEWTTFLLFKAAYVLFVLILSILSTSAVVYTVACIYIAKEITFKKVMSVVPKVWKRLMVTFIWMFVLDFANKIVPIIVIIVWPLSATNEAIRITTCVLLLIIYMMGLLYILIVLHLAIVVTVLEDRRGIEAMVKSNALIKGKMGVTVVIFLLLMPCSIGIHYVFQLFVVFGLAPSTGMRIVYGIGCLLLQVGSILFGLTILTVIYFVCKSYHHENIDESSMADHLEVYFGDHVALIAKDVQLAHCQV